MVWLLKLTLPLTAPLAPVIVSGSPFGSLSLASRVEAEIVSGVSRVAANPLSTVAIGA